MFLDFSHTTMERAPYLSESQHDFRSLHATKAGKESNLENDRRRKLHFELQKRDSWAKQTERSGRFYERSLLQENRIQSQGDSKNRSRARHNVVMIRPDDESSDYRIFASSISELLIFNQEFAASIKTSHYVNKVMKYTLGATV